MPRVLPHVYTRSTLVYVETACRCSLCHSNQSYISRGISTSTRAVYLTTSFSSRVQIHGISIRCKQFGTMSILKRYINTQLGCLKSNNKHGEDRTSVTERDKLSSFYSGCDTVTTPRPISLSTRQNTRCKL